MPGSFIASDLSGLLDTDEFAVSATWTPPAGATSTISVILDQGSTTIDGEAFTLRSRIYAIHAAAADVSGIVLTSTSTGKPKFTISGADYTIVDLVWSEDGNVVTAMCKK